jgi:beta-glucosidase
VQAPAALACDHFHRFREDFDLARNLSHNAHRFSLEWSRIEPESGEFSNVALDHYRRMCGACHELGLEPIVTFHHFTTPRWLAARGGWAEPRVADAFARRARELGLGEKHLWLTGTASAVAREQLQQQGWTLHEQSEAELWARR